MNNLREKIDSELKDMSFNCDTDNFEKRLKSRNKKIRNIVTPIVCVFLLGGLAILTLKGGNKAENPNYKADAASEKTSNRFIITAYAAEISQENSTEDTALQEYELYDDGGLIIPQFRLEVTQIEQPEKTYKVFHPIGSSKIGVKGGNIEAITYQSKISGFREYDGTVKSRIEREYDSNCPENSSVEWLLPEEVSFWMEKQNEPGYEFRFSDLPTDTVTISVTFSDGSVQKKSVDLYFNDNGFLVMKTENSVFNDFSGDEENYTEITEGNYDENGNLISWRVTGYEIEN